MLPGARLAGSHQDWGARDNSTQSPRGGWPPGTSIAGFRLLDCERSCCSCCSSVPVCGTLLRQPPDTNKEGNLTPFCTRGKGTEVQGTPPMCLAGKSAL